MKALLGSAFTLVVGVITVMSSGCAVTGGGYGHEYEAGYYQSYGTDYGGWGPGYNVGPVRDGDHGRDRGGGGRPPQHGGNEPAQHAKTPVPASRPVPSIPSGSRSEGGSRPHEH